MWRVLRVDDLRTDGVSQAPAQLFHRARIEVKSNPPMAGVKDSEIDTVPIPLHVPPPDGGDVHRRFWRRADVGARWLHFGAPLSQSIYQLFNLGRIKRQSNRRNARELFGQRRFLSIQGPYRCRFWLGKQIIIWRAQHVYDKYRCCDQKASHCCISECKLPVSFQSISNAR